MHKPRLLKWIISLGMFLMPSVIYAQTKATAGTIDFRAPATDFSLTFLGNIFGVVDGILHSTGSQIMGQMFGVFNAAVLALIGIILMYTLIMSTVSTANEGLALGKKWSNLWVPVRSAVGIALLVPKASGYCLMQIFVMWVITLGVGGADKIWSAALDYMARGGVITTRVLTPVSDHDDKVTVAGNMLKAHVCMRGLNYSINQARLDAIKHGFITEGGQNDPGELQNLENTVQPIQAYNNQLTTNPAQITIAMPTIKSGAYTALNGACGVLKFNTFSGVERENMARNLGISKTSETLSQATLARAIAVQAMYSMLGNVAQRIVVNYTNTPENLRQPLGQVSSDKSLWISPNNNSPLLAGTELKGAASSYYGIMRPTLTALASDMRASREFIKKAKEDGWIMAGSYFFKLTKLNSAAAIMIKDTGSVRVDLPAAITSNNYEPVVKLILTSPKNVLLQKASLAKVVTAVSATDNYIENAKQLKQTVLTGTRWMKWDPEINFPTLEIPSFSKQSFSGGPFGIAGAIAGFVYNDMFVPIANGVMGAINDLLNVIIDAAFKPILEGVDEFTAMLFNMIDSPFFKGDRNPIVELSMLGGILLNSALILWIVVSFAAALVGSIPILGSAVMGFLMFFMPVIKAIMYLYFTEGFMMAYYIPLVPYLFFTFSTMGWFLEALQAMLAAPLLALGISHPEGQHEMFGRAEPGILLLLSTFLRPMLMVLGYIIGIIFCYALIWMLNLGFSRAMSGMINITEGAARIAGPLVLILVYVFMASAFVTKAFTPIFELHKLVMQIFGYQAVAGFDVAAMAGEVKSSLSSISNKMGDGMRKGEFGDVGALPKEAMQLGRKGATSGIQMGGKAAKAGGSAAGGVSSV